MILHWCQFQFITFCVTYCYLANLRVLNCKQRITLVLTGFTYLWDPLIIKHKWSLLWYWHNLVVYILGQYNVYLLCKAREKSVYLPWILKSRYPVSKFLPSHLRSAIICLPALVRGPVDQYESTGDWEWYRSRSQVFGCFASHMRKVWL